MIIFPSFDFPKTENTSYFSFLQSVEQSLEEILPPEILLHKEAPEEFHQSLSQLLPWVFMTQLGTGRAFGVSILCSAEYSHGTGRFLSDTLSRRLIPGKILEFGGTRTLSFFFFKKGGREYLINERWIIADSDETVELIRKNLPTLLEELRLTLLSISKIRHFLSLKGTSFDGKELFLKEFRTPLCF